jgi:tRNA threonylcarbamoyladenosine biosynthesis protein TsaE
MEKLLHIASEQETEQIGEAIGRAAEPGTVVALIGDLGTGKTTLTKSIARGLGVTETVTSPTFNIIREYKSGRIPLYHFDVYRIGDPDEMFELGYEEYFYGDGICVVEWADIIEELLPEDTVIIRIERGASEEEREYRIESEDGKLCIF